MTMTQIKSEMIQFSSENQARLVLVPQEIDSRMIIDVLELPQPHALLVLNGGTALIEEDIRNELDRLLQDGLAHFASEKRVTLITGGTNAGIFALLDQGLARWKRTAPCIGLAVTGWVTWPGRDISDLPDWWFARDIVSLGTHHSHFVLVEAKDWGDETLTMYSLAQILSHNCPSLAIFAGGGEITKLEMAANIKQGRKMILLSGSGRVTDSVLAVRAGQSIDDSRLLQIAHAGKIIPFDIEQGCSQFVSLLYHLLFE